MVNINYIYNFNNNKFIIIWKEILFLIKFLVIYVVRKSIIKFMCDPLKITLFFLQLGFFSLIIPNSY